MFRFENVLVAIRSGELGATPHDISSPRLTPVGLAAIDLALVSGAQLTFCAVVGPRQVDGPSNALAVQMADLSDEDVRRELISLQEHATTKGVSARCLIRSGNFIEELIAESFEDPYDLVMFGQTSTGTVDQSSSVQMLDKLISQARCSVWAINPANQSDTPSIGYVSLARDSSALPLAVTLARLLIARLHVMHPINRCELTGVHNPSISDSATMLELAGLRQKAESELKTQLERTDFRALPFGSKLEILDDDSETEIVKYATENLLDLLIVDRQRMIRQSATSPSLREEWSDLAKSHSILAVVPNPN